MKIIDLSKENDEKIDIRGIKYTSDGMERESIPSASENYTDIFINGSLTMKLVCSPNLLPELVIGRLWSEGMISDASEIDVIHVCEYGSKVEVIINRAPEEKSPDFAETVSTCCTGNRLISDAFRASSPPSPVTPVEWKKEWIFSLARRFEEHTPLYVYTGSTHSCFLARENRVLYIAEDIGRHNAMDKVIGSALKDGVDLKSCILYSSGRLPTDMVSKAIRAGIPILCTKAMVTDKAAELANEFSLTLLCRCRPDKFSLVSPI